MNFIKQIWHEVVPESLRLSLYEIRIKKIEENKRNSVLTYYQKYPVRDAEINEALSYLEKNPITALPYSFLDQYKHKEITVLIDTHNQLPYVQHGREKLYFKRSWNAKRITESYRMLLAEQDPESPHRYLTKSYNINPGSIVVDVGAAEGIFAIHEMEKITHLFLIEADQEWIEALEATYHKWADKVTILKKFASSLDDEKNVRLDTYFYKYPVIDFLKIDVDGAEQELLWGASELISKKVRKIVICTYHKKDDNKEFTKYLKKVHFNTYNSEKYMLFFHDTKFTPPFFRRGLLKGEK